MSDEPYDFYRILGEEDEDTAQKEREEEQRRSALSLLLRLHGQSGPGGESVHLLKRKLHELLLSSLEGGGPQAEGGQDLRESLPGIEARFVEQAMFPGLRKACVVGVGGQFSAGKSRFLNSISGLSGEVSLPVNQSPTTAVATYLVHSSQMFMEAFTSRMRRVSLSAGDLALMAHTFLDDYGIGIAPLLDKIVIGVPELQPEHVALLDTPGYNPAGQQEEGKHDRDVALTHLRGCDMLIWLITKGTLEKTDLDMLKAVRLEHPVLLVLNMADKHTESSLRDMLEELEGCVASAGIPCFGVTAYSSLERREYFGRTFIRDFFVEAGNMGADKKDARQEFRELQRRCEESFQKRRKENDDLEDRLRQGIRELDTPMDARALVDGYHAVCRRREELAGKRWRFNRLLCDIENLMEEYERRFRTRA